VEENVNIPVDSEITDEDKMWALLCFIFPPLLGIIALLMEDKAKRPFIKYAAVLSIALGIITIVLSWACVGVIAWIYSIYLGIKAYNGEWVEVPFLTDFVQQQGWASKG
jgi:uncharacterized membrane protein